MSNNHKTITKRPRNPNRLPFSFSRAEAEAVEMRLREVRRADDAAVLLRVQERLSSQLRRSGPAAVAQRADAAFEAQVFESDLPAIAGEGMAAE